MPTRQRHSTGRTARVTQPGQVNEKHVEIKRPDRYILTIGFEVNNENAYTQENILAGPVDFLQGQFIRVKNNQNLSEDFGHAFIYVTKNDIVMSSFSFGPAIGAGNIKEMIGNRPGDGLYDIGEVAKLFRFKITQEQAEKIKENTDKIIQKIASKQIQYTPYKNDTCAAVAKQILDDSNIETPSGKSYASYEIIKIDFTTPVTIVTPYQWYHELLQKYPEPISFENTGLKDKPTNARALQNWTPYTLKDVWVATPGEPDPLSNQDRKILHDKSLPPVKNKSK